MVHDNYFVLNELFVLFKQEFYVSNSIDSYNDVMCKDINLNLKFVTSSYLKVVEFSVGKDSCFPLWESCFYPLN